MTKTATSTVFDDELNKDMEFSVHLISQFCRILK